MPPKKAAAGTKKPTAKKTTKAKATTKAASPAKKTFSKKAVSIYQGSAKDKHLVIVESPAKAKTINTFLGNDFVVRASMGHVVDLPKKELGVDIKNNFTPTYQVDPDKKLIVSDLSRLAKEAKDVWLATDEDREGEAIARHIAQQLKLDIKKTPRLVFHEITKSAIQHAMDNARNLDMSLVDAQQARRVVDRLVGFQVSPVLWRKVQKGLSAGRVQSVAVRLLVEREREIQAFVPEEERSLNALLEVKNGKKSDELEIQLQKLGKKAAVLKTRKDVEKILETLGISISKGKESKDDKQKSLMVSFDSKLDFRLQDIEKKQSKKTPPAPFITSTLQQTASSRFGRAVKQVMSVAQKLYENGFITYMRTDSTNLSSQAVAGCSDFINQKFGKEYLKNRQYASKSANAQEAHEAIRPTLIDRTPSQSGLSAQELKLYDLIRRRTVATQMSEAKLELTTYHFSPEADHEQDRTAKGSVITFDGFLKLYPIQTEDGDTILPPVEKDSLSSSRYITAKQHFSKPPARYSEASLVKALEAKGIGRPSTYAPTIATIQDRGYVIKEQKKLKPTDIAFLVTDFLQKHFLEMMDYDFTANMETKLDEIAEGKSDWKKMLKGFYSGFQKELEKAGEGGKEQMPVGRKCPKCNEGDLVYRFGKNGKFIGCNRYPDCDYIEETKEQKDQLDSLREQYEGKPCPAGGTIVVKVGRFGPFLTSSDYPKVKRIQGIPDPKIQELETKFGGVKCEKCGKGTMHVKTSKRGPFLACDQYPTCKNIASIKQTVQENNEA